MPITDIKYIFRSHQDLLDKKLSVHGWIRTIRSSKDFGFIELNDGTFFKSLQIVFDQNLENFAEIEKLHISSAIRVHGTLVKSPAPKQPFELHAEKIELIGASDEDYPLQKKRHSFEYLRTIAHLRPRSNTFSAVFRVRNTLCYAIHKYFNEKGFLWVHSPILTKSDCEGAGAMFQVTDMNLEKLEKDKLGKINYENDFFGQ
ncbi:MAG: OB-fold nucleic acid binding domain-containing protein, partial [Patescibacteria group bacterium]|nr:OB-fold nucleic acid binding domain-containing protein [Patescibacteria group bacterium]